VPYNPKWTSLAEFQLLRAADRRPCIRRGVGKLSERRILAADVLRTAALVRRGSYDGLTVRDKATVFRLGNTVGASCHVL
jgi:hypothetical protein